jgi:hypothetical protein
MQENTFNYWIDWLDAHNIDHANIPNKELITWMNDMEEAIGEYFMDMVPPEWLDDDEDELEELPNEDDEED